MRDYRYRLVNVFTVEGNRFSGNPLCVFEDARGLSDAAMQALALQFNLSETTFILPSDIADARVRIFTPAFEMPFAGHPTLGTAHVVRSLQTRGDAIKLEMKAGVIPVNAIGDTWTLQANAPTHRPVETGRKQLAQMLGITLEDIGEQPLWVNTGNEQLVIPLRRRSRALPTAGTVAPTLRRQQHWTTSRLCLGAGGKRQPARTILFPQRHSRYGRPSNRLCLRESRRMVSRNGFTTAALTMDSSRYKRRETFPTWSESGR